MALQANPHVTVSINHGTEQGANLLGRLAARITGAFQSYQASVRAARDFEYLSRLSDRELRDIGITCRTDIPRVVFKRNFEEFDRR